MKQKFINFNKTGEAKAKYGADAVVIEQETKYGIQYLLMDGNGASMKYEKIYNSEEAVDEDVEADSPGGLIDENPEVDKELQGILSDYINAIKPVLDSENPNYSEVHNLNSQVKYIELSFGKIVNGKGSFLKGLAKTSGLKFAYEITKSLNKAKLPFKSVGLISGLKQASIELKDDLRELGIKQSQLDNRKGLQQALSTLKRKGEFKTLQRLMKFNLDFDKKGSKTLLRMLNIKDPRILNKQLNKHGLGKNEAKHLMGALLLKKKGKK